VEEVEQGRALDNQDANRVYRIESEPGAGGPFKHLIITPHAQYRMDWRSVTVPQVRAALRSFLKAFHDAKSRNDGQYKSWVEHFAKREPINWTDPRFDLTIVFSPDGNDRVRLVTTYWQGEPDPKPQQCRLGNNLQDWKTQKYRRSPSSPPVDQAAPSPPWLKSKPIENVHLNAPPSSDEALDGKPLHTDRTRTQATPGEDSIKPEDVEVSPVVQRRQNLAAVTGPTYPGPHRQREQRGQAKKYFQKYYRENRNRIKQRMRRWYRKWHANPRYKKDMDRRQDFPERFKRFPGGGVSSNKERSQKLRDEKKTASSSWNIPVWYLPRWEAATLQSIDLDIARATLGFPAHPGKFWQVTLESLFDSIVFENDSDLDTVIAYLDRELEYTGGDEDVEKDDDLADAWFFDRRAHLKQGWMLERFPADIPAEQKLDRGTDYPLHRDEDDDPLPGLNNIPEVFDNPGSAKVIPENKDFVNRTAVKMSEISEQCDEDLLGQSGSLRPKLRKVDLKNLMWLFDVPGTKDTYRVRVKAVPKGGTLALAKLDILTSCTCPYWQWQGPEHWASVDGYLYGSPVGTASKPAVKDPNGTHRACKHVLACFDMMSEYSLRKGKTGSSRTAAIRLARWYLERILMERSPDAHL
jgi:hypothetical protein